MPFRFKISADPIPESSRICGEQTEPALMMTSFFAFTVYVFPPFMNSTPDVIRPEASLFGSKITLDTNESVHTERFGRPTLGA